MIKVVDGKTVAYLDALFTPVAREEDAIVTKVIHPDGRIEFTRKVPAPSPLQTILPDGSVG
jgi:hypothetical protein